MEKSEFIKELDNKIKESKTLLFQQLNNKILIESDSDNLYLTLCHVLSRNVTDKLTPKLYQLVESSLQDTMNELDMNKRQLRLFDLS